MHINSQNMASAFLGAAALVLLPFAVQSQQPGPQSRKTVMNDFKQCDGHGNLESARFSVTRPGNEPIEADVKVNNGKGVITIPVAHGSKWTDADMHRIGNILIARGGAAHIDCAREEGGSNITRLHFDVYFKEPQIQEPRQPKPKQPLPFAPGGPVQWQ